LDDERSKREIDRRDFNAELIGADIGRQHRFIPAGFEPKDTEQKKKEERFESALRRLLLDPEYARLYQSAWGALNETQSALDKALLANARAQERLQTVVDDMESRAATLPNGEKVFRGGDGKLYTATGRKLSDVEARGVDMPKDAPSYDAYLQAQFALRKAIERGIELTGIQTTVLDPIRKKLGDEDNPPTPDELRKIIKILEEAKSDCEISGPTAEFRDAAAPAMKPADEEVLDLSAIPALPPRP
jgi:hypothetical protein